MSAMTKNDSTTSLPPPVRSVGSKPGPGKPSGPKGARNNNAANGGARTGSRRRNGGRHSKRYHGPAGGTVSGSDSPAMDNSGPDSRSNSLPALNDDDLFEQSLLRSSKRGVDISHLLDFSIADDESRELESAATSARRGNRRNRRRSSHNNRTMPQVNLTGRNYINVNCKFIVDYNADYKPQILDPSLPLEDNSIVRVIVNGNDYHCPICLGDEFIAPRMTRCGHIFCYPCLLRLLASSEEEHEKETKRSSGLGNRTALCPLCNETIREKHRLLPVLTTDEHHQHPHEHIPVPGETVEMTLMCRAHNKVFAQPLQFFLEDSQYDGNIPWIEKGSTVDDFFESSKYTPYARIMKCDRKFIESCFERELSSIEQHKIYDKEVYNDPGLHYDLAKMNIGIAMASSKELYAENDVEAPEYRHTDAQSGHSSLTEQEIESLLLKQAMYVPKSDEPAYYFYQCLTGPNTKVKYFLSALDVQLLKAIYGDYSQFPFNLRLRLENINYDDSMVTEDLIHKLKYIGHLPVGTEVGFLELDWMNASHSMIPPDVYSQFKKKLKDRSRRTRSKKLKEDRNKKTFERELELKTLQFYSSENNLPLEEYGYNLKSENEFNHFPASRRTSNDVDLPSLEQSFESNNEATILSTASPSTSPSQQAFSTSVWGTRVPISEEAVVESFEVEQMIQQAKLEQQQEEQQGGKNKTKKKKKKKKIILRLG